MNPILDLLRPYQVAHFRHLAQVLLKNGAALDASDTGVGKTYVAMALAKLMEVTPFVLGPKGVEGEWKRAGEVLQHPVNFLNYEKAIRPKYELGELKPCGKGSFWVWHRTFNLLIFDEVHKCGGSTSATGKLLRSARKASPHVLALSATAADDPRQMKGLCIATGICKNSEDFFWWLKKHGISEVGFGTEFTGDNKDMERIHRQIFPARGARMRRALIPDFPKTEIDVLVLPTVMDRAVEELAEMPETPSAERTALLQSIELGAVELLFADKIPDAVLNGFKVALFLNYTASIDDALKRAGKNKLKANIFDGRNGDIRSVHQQDFRDNKLDLIIVQCMAGGAGLSLHDEITQVPRRTFILPPEQGRLLKQIFGRVHRDSGGFSYQSVVTVEGTPQQKTMERGREKLQRIDSLNDAEISELNY